MVTSVANRDRAIAELTTAVQTLAALEPSPDEIHALTRLSHASGNGTSRDGVQYLYRAVERGGRQPAVTGTMSTH